MALMLGPRLLADETSLHDAGIAEGTMLCIISTSKYKLLVSGVYMGNMELWTLDAKPETTVFMNASHILAVEFSPDNALILARESHRAKLWRVDTRECLFGGGASEAGLGCFQPSGHHRADHLLD